MRHTVYWLYAIQIYTYGLVGAIAARGHALLTQRTRATMRKCRNRRRNANESSTINAIIHLWSISIHLIELNFAGSWIWTNEINHFVCLGSWWKVELNDTLQWEGDWWILGSFSYEPEIRFWVCGRIRHRIYVHCAAWPLKPELCVDLTSMYWPIYVYLCHSTRSAPSAHINWMRKIFVFIFRGPMSIITATSNTSSFCHCQPSYLNR